MKWLLIVVLETGPGMPGLDVQHMDSEKECRAALERVLQSPDVGDAWCRPPRKVMVKR